MTGVDAVVRCPKCDQETMLYEYETRSCEERAACETCGYWYQHRLELKCIDCGKAPQTRGEPFDIYTDISRGHKILLEGL
jgi:ribosomal protein S27E